MRKRGTDQQWLIIAEFLGGPVCGDTVELGAVGSDPLTAFVEAVQRDDIPERLCKSKHYYSIAWSTLREVEIIGGVAAGSVLYVFEGLQ